MKIKFLNIHQLPKRNKKNKKKTTKKTPTTHKRETIKIE